MSNPILLDAPQPDETYTNQAFIKFSQSVDQHVQGDTPKEELFRMYRQIKTHADGLPEPVNKEQQKYRDTLDRAVDVLQHHVGGENFAKLMESCSKGMRATQGDFTPEKSKIVHEQIKKILTPPHKAIMKNKFSENIENKRFALIYASLHDRQLISSKSHIAKILGTYNHMINSILQGTRKLTVKQIQALCKHFKINANYLFGLSDDMYIDQERYVNLSMIDRRLTDVRNAKAALQMQMQNISALLKEVIAVEGVYELARSLQQKTDNKIANQQSTENQQKNAA